MTRTTNARIAGFTFLFYIAAGIASMALFGQAARGPDIAEKLAGIARHMTQMRAVVLLGLAQSASALVLAVTLFAITREQDRDLAILGLTCRVTEGISGLFVPRALGLLWLATATGPNAPEAGAAHALGSFLLKTAAWSPGAIFFAFGSTLFSWLLLRGRMIPVALAWLGVFASLLLAVVLPLQLAGFLGGSPLFAGPAAWLIWLPMLVFEVVLAVWLLVKGVAAPVKRIAHDGSARR